MSEDPKDTPPMPLRPNYILTALVTLARLSDEDHDYGEIVSLGRSCPCNGHQSCAGGSRHGEGK